MSEQVFARLGMGVPEVVRMAHADDPERGVDGALAALAWYVEQSEMLTPWWNFRRFFIHPGHWLFDVDVSSQDRTATVEVEDSQSRCKWAFKVPLGWTDEQWRLNDSGEHMGIVQIGAEARGKRSFSDAATAFDS